MFNPFNPFQAATDAAKSADAAGNMTSGPFGPSFAQAKGKMEDWQQQMQGFFNPQKMFDGAFNMNAVKDMFPKELTQAWSAFVPPSTANSSSNPMEKMQQMGQQFAQQAQQTMQAMQGAAQQAATPTGSVSSNLGSVDFSGLIAAQQKNMETLSQAQTATVNGWQQVMKRQAEIFHDTMQTAAAAMNELMATGAPEEKLARQADIAKQAFETAGKNIEELAQLVTQGNQEAMRTISARVQESLDEIKAAAQKNPLTKAAADVAEKTTQAASSMMQNAASTASSATTSAFRTAADTASSTDAVQ